jgi:Zn-finger nucleic acid-binding protein
MQCPRCPGVSLLELDRDGITLDRCEACRGIWLDRGELERLLARAKQADESSQRVRSRDEDDDDDDDRRGHVRGGERRRSWWEIFD